MSFTSEPISDCYAEKLDKVFGIKDCFFEYNPGKFIMTAKFSDIAQDILDFKVRKDDIWTISYPRTGSTWCQEMVWLIGNDQNYDVAKKTIQQSRAPVLEHSALLSTKEYEDFMKSVGNSVHLVKNYPSPRYIKSHLPFILLPLELEKVKPKIIYVARNPKDTCVSYYHYCQLAHNLQCTFEEFCDLFLNGKVPVGPIWPHYLTFWNKRHESNVLFLKYEDMKKDLKAIIRETAEFMGKSLSEEQVNTLQDYLEFRNMKNNRSVNAETILERRVGVNYQKESSNTFIRKGQVGDWKNYMTMDMSKMFDEWIEENSKGTELLF